MFFPEAQVRVWLYNQPTDMRKSYDGLSALVKTKLEEDPLSGQLFGVCDLNNVKKNDYTSMVV